MKKSRRQIETEMRDEMEFHRQSRVEHLIAGGMAPAAAERTARLEFGNPAVHREHARIALGFQPFDELRADLRYTVRTLRNAPGFAFAAVAILALAIGANAAFFTLYANYVLKPLPIRAVERHFDIETRNAKMRNTGGWTAQERDALAHAAAAEVEGFYTAETIQVLLLAPAQRHSLATYVSSNYFSLLGAAPQIGRVITPADEAQPVAVLSDNGWHRLFPAEPNPIGKTVRVKNTVFTIIGVAQPRFTGTEPVLPDLWFPNDRLTPALSGILKPGVSPARAQAVITATASRFVREDPERAVAHIDVSLRPSYLPDGDDTNTAAGLVFALFLLVLLIACANLANLYLARAASRTHEIAMRLSLGASRLRIIRQLLTESTFVALLGAAGGLAVSTLALEYANQFVTGFAAEMGISTVPPALDWRVFLFSAALALIAGLAFGLLPAIEVTSPSLTASTRRENSAFAGRLRPRRLRDLLIGGQVAASFVLLILSGILIRNIQRLNAVSPGYEIDQVYNLRVDSPTPALLARLRELPGVTTASAVAHVPLGGTFRGAPATNIVDHGYFETLGIPIDSGRPFTPAESRNNAKVAIVSQATARKLWPHQQPLGQTLTLDDSQRYQVIGVVPDVVSGLLFQGKDASAAYIPGAIGHPQVDSILVRMLAAAPAVRALCAALGSGCEPIPLREVAHSQRVPFQAAAAISAALGCLGLLLTVIGIYSVASYSVLQRRREIGIQLALGATPARILRRVLSQAIVCVAGGLAVGFPVSLALSNLASASVLNIQTFDALAYLGVPALLAAVAALACTLPARRAARTDPMTSLRQE
ncbi:MAG: ABC transporter permease [Bryobacterales bacterium]|nr:ABC transporter permease [Bryobacterales bacterium]